MPVTPHQARKFANERVDLLKKVDEAILSAYDNSVPTAVKIPIEEDVYNSTELMNFVEREYQKAGWNVNFEKERDSDRVNDYLYFVILKEKPPEKYKSND